MKKVADRTPPPLHLRNTRRRNIYKIYHLISCGL